MKIGVYSYVFYPETFLINELCFDLIKKGHTVSVSTGIPNYSTGFYQRGYGVLGPYTENVSDISIRRFPVVARRKGFFYLTLNYLSNIVFGCFNIFRMSNTEVSFVFGVSPIFVAIPPIILKKWTGTPVVIWLQDLWPDSFGAVAKVSDASMVYKLLGVIVRWIYRNTDVILIQSEAFRDHLMKYQFDGIVEYVPNWSPEVIAATSSAPSWIESLPKEEFILAFAGNIGKAQSLDTLLDAAKELRNESNFRIVIVGDGSELERLISRALGENISNVIFVGKKPVHDMPMFFERCSALFVSLRSDDLFSKVIPSKVQAYMSAGKPLLASLNGEGARIVLEAGAGYSSPADDLDSLVIAIRKMKGLGEVQRIEMGLRAKKYYMANFEKSRIVEKIARILKETI
ncbi:glycosyltransferase family 4 protein [Bdellovibrio sp. HCB288]|uniref:glycosyltransferase family 4 protein n=1 Tax=Bdellovibrio sp. HCB288 TaxID=3394355 RepID=UPI0039B3A1B6